MSSGWSLRSRSWVTGVKLHISVDVSFCTAPILLGLSPKGGRFREWGVKHTESLSVSEKSPTSLEGCTKPSQRAPFLQKDPGLASPIWPPVRAAAGKQEQHIRFWLAGVTHGSRELWPPPVAMSLWESCLHFGICGRADLGGPPALPRR